MFSFLLPWPSSEHSLLACFCDCARLGNPNYCNIADGLNAAQNICHRQGMRVSILVIQNSLNLHLPVVQRLLPFWKRCTSKYQTPIEYRLRTSLSRFSYLISALYGSPETYLSLGICVHCNSLIDGPCIPRRPHIVGIFQEKQSCHKACLHNIDFAHSQFLRSI